MIDDEEVPDPDQLEDGEVRSDGILHPSKRQKFDHVFDGDRQMTGGEGGEEEMIEGEYGEEENEDMDADEGGEHEIFEGQFD